MIFAKAIATMVKVNVDHCDCCVLLCKETAWHQRMANVCIHSGKFEHNQQVADLAKLPISQSIVLILA
jgi:hypothetical protein